MPLFPRLSNFITTVTIVTGASAADLPSYEVMGRFLCYGAQIFAVLRFS